jgi:hypothetical protein
MNGKNSPCFSRKRFWAVQRSNNKGSVKLLGKIEPSVKQVWKNRPL